MQHPFSRLLPRLLTAAACAALVPSALATRYYVDDDAAPGGDGLSWSTAFDALDDALAIIQPGDRIWLAEGHYVPDIERTPGDPRSVTFFVPAGVRIYGGFAGNEGTFAARAGLFDTTRAQRIQLDKTGFYEVYTSQGNYIVAVNADPRESDLTTIAAETFLTERGISSLRNSLMSPTRYLPTLSGTSGSVPSSDFATLLCMTVSHTRSKLGLGGQWACQHPEK